MRMSNHKRSVRRSGAGELPAAFLGRGQRIVNLDHGWTNPAPRSAMDDLVRSARELERLPADRLPRWWETISSTKLRTALAAYLFMAYVRALQGRSQGAGTSGNGARGESGTGRASVTQE